MGVIYGVSSEWIYNTRAGGLHQLVTDGLVLLLDAGNTSSYNTESPRELITNGTFDSNVSGWNDNGSCTLLLVSNKMQITRTGTDENAYQAFTTIPGVTYVVRTDINSVGSLGVLRIVNGSGWGGPVLLELSGTNGVDVYLTGTFIATSTTTTLGYKIADPSTSIIVENVSVSPAWTDLSGNGKHATLINGPTYSSDNRGHLVFDGTNDRLDLQSSLNLSTNTGFTMCLFLQQTTPQTGAAWNYFFQRTSPTIEMGAFGTGNTIFRFKDNDIPVEINSGNVTTSWSYIAFGTNPSTRTPFMHRFSSSGYALTTSATAFSNTTLSFSRMFGGFAASNYGAKVATIQAYNRTLTATEVTQNYNVLKGRFGLP
jgi:hypothetical protein